MLVVGIVGGAGAGKSEVLQLLGQMGAATVAADELNRLVLAPGQPTLIAVREAFGPEFFDSEGTLLRRKLGDCIFRDQAARLKLETIVYPAMLRLLKQRLAAWRTAGIAVAAVEAAVLEQMGALDLVDVVLLVSASKQSRRERLMRRDDLSEEQVESRLQVQEALGLETPAAEMVIVNKGDLQGLAKQVEQFWKRFVLKT